MKEIWKDVVGYEGLYEVSNLARICRGKLESKVRKYRDIINQRLDHHGYLVVDLWKKAIRKRPRVHVLLMEAWRGERTQRDIRHLDGDKLNNSLNNLKYGNRSENMKDDYKHNPGRMGFQLPWLLKKAVKARIPVTARGEKHGLSKLTEKAIKDIRVINKGKKLPAGMGMILAKKWGVSKGHISFVRSGKVWKHVN